MTRHGPVLLDTDAYSLVFLRGASADTARVADWRALLSGRQVVISFQSRAEVLQGALASGWGERRRSELRSRLNRTPTVWGDREVVDAHSLLYAECRRAGHALQDKQHTGDRWVAACAIAKGVPLLAGDGVYRGAPRLELAI